MAFGYKPNTSQITTALNNILESREKREASEQASEERILALQRDAFESDRDWNEKLADKVKTNLEGLISGAKDKRHYNVQSFRDSYMTPLYNTYKDSDEGFRGLKQVFLDSKLDDFMANQMAGLVWSAGVNNTDHVPVIEFADLISNEILDPDETFENSLIRAGMLPPAIDLNRNEAIFYEADEVRSNHQEVIELNQKLQSFYNIHPSKLIKNISSGEFDMGDGVFGGGTGEGDDGDDGAGGGAGGNTFQYSFSSDEIESVFDMERPRQEEFFASIGFGNPSYSMEITEDAINQNLEMNADWQLALDKLDDIIVEDANTKGYNLTAEEMLNINKLIELRRKLLQQDATTFTNNLDKLPGAGGGVPGGVPGDVPGGVPGDSDQTQYGYMGKFGADVKQLPASVLQSAYKVVMNMGAGLEDNKYAAEMRDIIREKSILAKAISKLVTIQEIPVEKRRTDYDNTLRLQTERVEKLQNEYDNGLLDFNERYQTNISPMQIPLLTHMQWQGKMLSKDNSPNNIMRRKR